MLTQETVVLKRLSVGSAVVVVTVTHPCTLAYWLVVWLKTVRASVFGFIY